MAEDTKTRRAFVKGAAQVAVTAPAVAILLSSTSAKAQITPGYVFHVGDDASVSFADDSFTDDTFIVPGDDGTAGGGST